MTRSTITGANFISPTVELIGPQPAPYTTAQVRYSLQPYEVTSGRFKLFLTREILKGARPPMRLVVTTPYGSVTSAAEMTFSGEPRIDTVIVTRELRQARTPQEWWQRVIILKGRNLEGPLGGFVAGVPLAASDMRTVPDWNPTTIQIDVPRYCNRSGRVQVELPMVFGGRRIVLSAQQVTCLPNDEISSP